MFLLGDTMRDGMFLSMVLLTLLVKSSHSSSTVTRSQLTSMKSRLISDKSLLIWVQLALLCKKTFLGLVLLTLGLVFMTTIGMPSWSLMPGTTMDFSTRVLFDVKNRSRMLFPRVSLVTTWSKPRSLQISIRSQHNPGLGHFGIVHLLSQSIWDKLKSPASQIFWFLLVSILDKEECNKSSTSLPESGGFSATNCYQLGGVGVLTFGLDMVCGSSLKLLPNF